MSRIPALAVAALLLSASGAALADPPDRGGHRARGEVRGEHRNDGPRNGGDRARAEGRRNEGAGAPPVTSNEPGRGQRSWADRPRVDPTPQQQDGGAEFRGRDRSQFNPGSQGGGDDRVRRGEGGRDFARRDGGGQPPQGGDRWRDNGGRQGGPGGQGDAQNAGQGERWRGEGGRSGGRDGGQGLAGGDDRWRGQGGRDGSRGDGDRWTDRGRDGDGRSGDRNWSDSGRERDRGDDRWRNNDDGRRYADNRSHGRPGYGRPLRDRDYGRHWYDRQHFNTHYRASHRYRGPVYIFPQGYYVRAWRFGEYLPYGWYHARYYLDWRYYDLPFPPIGCEWIRVGRDALLVDVWTGEILSVWYDLFW